MKVAGSPDVPTLPYWNDKIAAGAIAILVFPLTNLKTITALIKVSSLGIISIIYNMVFIIYWSIGQEGFHFQEVEAFQPKFYYLSGILVLRWVLSPTHYTNPNSVTFCTMVSFLS